VQANADFGFANVFLLDNREQAVDVSNPYDQDSGCFAVPKLILKYNYSDNFFNQIFLGLRIFKIGWV
jgi:hypothetical protein